jgi:hypothetical protein
VALDSAVADIFLPKWLEDTGSFRYAEVAVLSCARPMRLTSGRLRRLALREQDDPATALAPLQGVLQAEPEQASPGFAHSRTWEYNDR